MSIIVGIGSVFSWVMSHYLVIPVQCVCVGGVHAVGSPRVTLRFVARPQWLFEGLWKLVERVLSGI